MSNNTNKPRTVGVFGGSFNPIHLGHALLAITAQQTTAVDEVVLVPVYRHAVKRDLLPFEDRVHMCRLAIAAFGDALSVSTIEQEVGASNGAMLQALKRQYPADTTKFVWICGDDFIRWMDRPKGLETLREVSGLIVQRRLHKQQTDDSSSSAPRLFVQEPVDDTKLRTVAAQLDLSVDFIYGELPHFSSSLVRRAPGHWRSFLTQSVIQYLDARPHLLDQLLANLQASATDDDGDEKQPVLHRRTPSTLESMGQAGACVLRGLDAVHALQSERGRAGLFLAGCGSAELKAAQARTDRLLSLMIDDDDSGALLDNDFDEVRALHAELRRIPVWLEQDRWVLQKRGETLAQCQGTAGWLARWALVEKFNPRIDVLGACVRCVLAGPSS